MFDLMRKKNTRCIQVLKSHESNHVTLSPESLVSVWAPRPPARVCTISRRGAEVVKSKLPAYVSQK